MSPPTLRLDLVLPNELLHKVILSVISDSVHSICTSNDDTTWEKNLISTLHQVSPAFKAISTEIAVKAFDISKDVRDDEDALLRTLREIFLYLSLLGTRFRQPSHWSTISFQTIDCLASSFVFAYALYLSCISLRRNAIHSVRETFESTHKVVLSGLDQSKALCARVKPAEITELFKTSVDREYELTVLGLNLVQGFNDLYEYSDALSIFQQHVTEDGTGPLTGALHLTHIALSKVEGAYQRYEAVLSTIPSHSDPHAYQLPGVVRSLKRLATLKILHDEHDLRERIRKIKIICSEACPFLQKCGGPNYYNPGF